MEQSSAVLFSFARPGAACPAGRDRLQNLAKNALREKAVCTILKDVRHRACCSEGTGPAAAGRSANPEAKTERNNGYPDSRTIARVPFILEAFRRFIPTKGRPQPSEPDGSPEFIAGSRDQTRTKNLLRQKRSADRRFCFALGLALEQSFEIVRSLPYTRSGVWGNNSDRCQWQREGAVVGAALRFSQGRGAPRRENRLSAREQKPQLPVALPKH